MLKCFLQANRQQIAKLSGVHSLLTKLQFLFELPSRLKKCLETKSYVTAVNYYSKTKAVLQHYQHMESFSGIERDCRTIINEIIVELKEVFHDKVSFKVSIWPREQFWKSFFMFSAQSK